VKSTGDNKRNLSRLSKVLLAFLICGLIAVFAIPNFIRSGPGKTHGIVVVLMQIDAAKEQWAIEHGFTNASSTLRNITQQDIAPLFKLGSNKDGYNRMVNGFDKNGNIVGAQGVIFSINPLGVSPEAQFTKDFKLDNRFWFRGQIIPKGTILRLGTNGVEYILPGQESSPCKSLGELLSR
jgi:hypothetical protein